MKALAVAWLASIASIAATPRAPELPRGYQVLRPEHARELSERERATSEARPPLRNFFPPLGAGIDAPDAWRSARWDPPSAASDPLGARIAELVARRLARDGLLFTLAQALELAIQSPREPGADRAAVRERLASFGLPLDWIDRFAAPGGGDVVDWLLARLRAGARAPDLKPELDSLALRFVPSVAGFRAAEEDGSVALGALRVQISRSTYWQARGDGGALDLVQELLSALPDVEFVAAIAEPDVEPFLASVARAPARTATTTLVVQELPVAQWAQDDGKSGFAADGALVTLVPRYASRGEEASAWAPGEMRALEGFAATGRRVARSSLLFQGGNLIVARDPKSGERVLLAGETEVLRNRTLGLSAEQVVEALRLELGVERVVVLPAIAYHVDFEVSVRALDGELVCFVGDPLPAAQEVLRAALDVLAASGAMQPADVAAARAAVDAVDVRALFGLLGPLLDAQTVGAGRFRESFARRFARSEGDSHVANFERVLLAFDLFLASSKEYAPKDRHTRAFFDALRRRETARNELVAVLRAQGWRTVAVPNLSAGERGIVYLNGVQARGLYLMPAWGGLFARLDTRVRELLEREIGPGVRVVEIASAESQRRQGAVRCSVGVLPAR